MVKEDIKGVNAKRTPEQINGEEIDKIVTLFCVAIPILTILILNIFLSPVLNKPSFPSITFGCVFSLIVIFIIALKKSRGK